MKKILCATRGGEESYRTQDEAITLAQEYDAELLFLYVVDIKFLDKTARAVRPDVVAAEMEKMGEFLLALAQERAQKRGVTARCILRHGDLRQELRAVACQEAVDLVVLGQPGAESVFMPSDLEACALEIEREAGAETRIV
jgi:nucleotide-binding universal stress UspA family protein